MMWSRHGVNAFYYVSLKVHTKTKRKHTSWWNGVMAHYWSETIFYIIFILYFILFWFIQCAFICIYMRFFDSGTVGSSFDVKCWRNKITCPIHILFHWTKTVIQKATWVCSCRNLFEFDWHILRLFIWACEIVLSAIWDLPPISWKREYCLGTGVSPECRT